MAEENPLAARGFFTGAPLNTFIPQDSERFDEIDDMVATMGTSTLALTIGCGRCLMISEDHIDDDDLEPLPKDRPRYIAVFAWKPTSSSPGCSSTSRNVECWTKRW